MSLQLWLVFRLPRKENGALATSCSEVHLVCPPSSCAQTAHITLVCRALTFPLRQQGCQIHTCQLDPCLISNPKTAERGDLHQNLTVYYDIRKWQYVIDSKLEYQVKSFFLSFSVTFRHSNLLKILYYFGVIFKEGLIEREVPSRIQTSACEPRLNPSPFLQWEPTAF